MVNKQSMQSIIQLSIQLYPANFQGVVAPDNEKLRQGFVRGATAMFDALSNKFPNITNTALTVEDLRNTLG